MKCGIDNLEKAIMEELQAYKQDVTDGLKADCKQVAKECKDDIKQNSPKRSGKYKKSWKIKVNHESKEDIRITVYNGKHYRLTHLLEDGHAGKGGTSKGAAPAYPHIAPAERRAAEKLQKKVKITVRKGKE